MKEDDIISTMQEPHDSHMTSTHRSGQKERREENGVGGGTWHDENVNQMNMSNNGRDNMTKPTQTTEKENGGKHNQVTFSLGYFLHEKANTTKISSNQTFGLKLKPTEATRHDETQNRRVGSWKGESTTPLTTTHHAEGRAPPTSCQRW